MPYDYHVGFDKISTDIFFALKGRLFIAKMILLSLIQATKHRRYRSCITARVSLEPESDMGHESSSSQAEFFCLRYILFM